MAWKIGRYDVDTRLAAGGMAEVYKAHLRGPDGFTKEYALKLMLPETSEDPAQVQMFLDEARLASRLVHPNLCQIFELGLDGGRHFIVMELLDGQTLRDVWHRARALKSPMDPLTCAWIIARAAEGLAFAHERRAADGSALNIVHRDVSPDNVMLTVDGQVKVLDFGIARASQRSVHTATGVVRGKIDYMAPEQIRGEPVDARADVFALGVVLHGLLANQPVFKRENDAQTMYAVLGRVLPVRPVGSAVPKALWEIADGCLAREVSQRTPSARALFAALDALVQAAGVDGPGLVAKLAREPVPKAAPSRANALGGLPRESLTDVHVEADPAAFIATARREGAGAPARAAGVIRGGAAADFDRAQGAARDGAAEPGSGDGAQAPGTREFDGSVAPGTREFDGGAAPGTRELDGIASPRTQELDGSAAPGTRELDPSTHGDEGAPRPSRRRPLFLATAALLAVGLTFGVRAARTPQEPTPTPRPVAPLAQELTRAPVELPAPAPAPVEPPAPAPTEVVLPTRPTRPAPTRPPLKRQVHAPVRPKVAVAAAEPAETGGKGKLSLDTQPWTEVFLGSRRLGETPFEEVVVPAGRLTLRAVNTTLKLEKTFQIDVPRDQVVRSRKVW